MELNKQLTIENNFRVCEKCANVFARKLGTETISRCPACNVWKKEIEK